MPAPPDEASLPSVPERVDGERDLKWGRQPEGTIVLDGDRSSLSAFAVSLRATDKRAYTPALPAGIDVGPVVYASANSAPGVYDQLIFEYGSAKYGWSGIWERAANLGEAETYLKTRLSQCDPPVECVPASPTQIVLDNGTPAMLTDPGGITWVQTGMIFELAGPWAAFDASRSLPLANAVSTAAAASPKGS